jgi:hypothetical protein
MAEEQTDATAYPPRQVARIQRQAVQVKEWTDYTTETVDNFITELQASLTRLKADYAYPEKEPKVNQTAVVLTRLKDIQRTLTGLRKDIRRI